MSNPPRAHRRLVPRVPKKKDPAEDLEVTAERVIVIEEPSESHELPVPRELPLPRELPRGSVDMPDESMEMTAVRDFVPALEADDFEDELYDDETRQRMIEPAGYEEAPNYLDDEDVDAGETSAHVPRSSLAQMLAGQSAVPQFDEVENNLQHPPLDANAFADSEPTALKPSTTLDAEDRPTTHISPAERGLLAAMSEGHEASRMVYVNWLERRGEVVRAEFLRLDCVLAQMSPEDPRYPPTRRRLLEIAPRISVDWRSRVARSLIEGCTTTTGRCPAYWRALPASADDVRNCGVCGENVYYCVSLDLARSRYSTGQRVAIDLSVDRYHGDLEGAPARCANCQEELPPRTRFCPHCGRAQ